MNTSLSHRVKRVTGFFLLCMLGTGAVQGADWFRDNAISPDGQTIVFSYKGDLYTVPSSGGRATRLTSNSAYDGFARWSPDGKTIAFSSDRYGSLDVFIIPREGGRCKRLTTHSQDEIVQAYLDGGRILYSAAIQADKQDIQYPSGFRQVWEVDTAAHRPQLFSSLAMERMSVNGRGEMLYQNMKGYEDYWRKHHRSPITRDIYLSQLKAEGRTYRKLTTDNCEHRCPVWAPDGRSYYYLSEQSGTLNVYRVDAVGGQEHQVTHFDKHPVRYLSIARDGKLCFSWDGSLYTLAEGGQPQKVNIQLTLDDNEDYNQPRTVSSGISSYAVSKNEKEIAFALNGYIYTKPMDYETTKQITHILAAESPSFSPDGRTIVYCAERDGMRQLYWTRLVNKSDKLFSYATDFKEEQLTHGKEPCILPKFSPDGKLIAFIANKTELRVMDVKTKAVKTVLPAKYNFSYSDGDIGFEWSPDSKWLLTSYMGEGGWNSMDIATVKADGSKTVNLTKSGYTDGAPQWALGGKAVIWGSDRAGYRSHGSWGTEDDVFIMYLDRDAYLRSKLSKEDRALYDERAKADSTQSGNQDNAARKSKGKSKASSSKSKGKGAAKTDSTKTDSIKPLKLDFDDCEDRIERLTINSSFLSNMYLSPDGTKLYYASRYEGGYDLWVHDLEKNTTKILCKGFGRGDWIPDAKGNNLYICNGTLCKLDLASGTRKELPFKAETEGQTATQRAFIYDHCVHQILNRFCDPDYHGVDFKSYAAHYREFLPSIGNSRDLSEMVSELLGELNCSHTGLKYQPRRNLKQTANLAAFYDAAYQGDGLKISEIVKGGSLDLPDHQVKEGDIIRQIDHQQIEAGKDYYPLLAGKAGKWVLLTVTDAKGKHSRDIYVKPVSQSGLSELLYKRWVDRNAAFVKDYSKGEVGYVHIEDMDSKSFRRVYSEMLGKYRNCKSIVVDERHNGGGWLHDDLAVLLSGKQFQTYTSRGQYLGPDPYSRWYRPNCVLVCEDCYSNANGFPSMYKALGLGKLVGAPMAGTMTAVWWEREIDPELVEGLPEVNCLDMKGRPCENQQLDPDIEVQLTPADQLSGHDTQLQRAVELMMGKE